MLATYLGLVTVPGTRPAIVIAAAAAVCVRPTRFGAVACSDPDEESGAIRGLAMNQILRRSIGRGALGMKSLDASTQKRGRIISSPRFAPLSYSVVDRRADCSRRTINAFKRRRKFFQEQHRSHGSHNLIFARNLTDFSYRFFDAGNCRLGFPTETTSPEAGGEFPFMGMF